MATTTMKVEIRGLAPLMVKSDQTVDPFNTYAIQMREITDKKKQQTEADKRKLRRTEWEAGLYYDPEIGPYIPGWNIVRSIRDGAARVKKGKAVLTGVTISDVKVPIRYDGPRDLDGMYDAGFVDVRRIVNNGAGATIRARPRWDRWSLVFNLDIDDEVISERDIIDAIQKAGRFAGIGEYRPSSKKGGQYGRYEIVKINGKAIEA